MVHNQLLDFKTQILQRYKRFSKIKLYLFINQLAKIVQKHSEREDESCFWVHWLIHCWLSRFEVSSILWWTSGSRLMSILGLNLNIGLSFQWYRLEKAGPPSNPNTWHGKTVGSASWKSHEQPRLISLCYWCFSMTFLQILIVENCLRKLRRSRQKLST